MIYLKLAEVVHVAERTLGSEVPLRDPGLLQSALARPQARAFGADTYATLRGGEVPLLERIIAFRHEIPRHDLT